MRERAGCAPPTRLSSLDLRTRSLRSATSPSLGPQSAQQYVERALAAVRRDGMAEVEHASAVRLFVEPTWNHRLEYAGAARYVPLAGDHQDAAPAGGLARGDEAVERSARLFLRLTMQIDLHLRCDQPAPQSYQRALVETRRGAADEFSRERWRRRSRRSHFQHRFGRAISLRGQERF